MTDKIVITTETQGKVRAILLVRQKKDVDVKIEGLKNSLIIWSKDLRPTADTTVPVQVNPYFRLL